MESQQTDADDQAEVKDESKETDGRPESRRYQAIADAPQRRMLQDVPDADVVITNPTHYSVALNMINMAPVPRVLLQGQDLIALKIRSIAIEHDFHLRRASACLSALRYHRNWR